MSRRNSYDDIADYLTDGYWEWRGEARRAFDVGPDGVLTADITGLNEVGQQLARWALEAWAGVSGIVFEFVRDDNAQIVFDDDGEEPVTRSTVIDGVIISSHVNIPADWLIEHGTTAHSFSFTTYLHEIGHALGLGSPGPYPDPGNPNRFHHSDRIFEDDSYLTTVMSSFYPNGQRYTTQVDTSVPVTPMIADIVAIQNLYGPPFEANAGDTVYGFQSGTGSHLDQFFHLWSGEENPLHGFEFRHISQPVFIDLDGDSDLDLITGNWGGYIDYFENIGTTAKPFFVQRTNAANPMDDIRSGRAPAFADLDGDGDPDFVYLDSKGNFHYIENTGTVTDPGFTERTGGANPLLNLSLEPTTLLAELTYALADLDDDGDIDLVATENVYSDDSLNPQISVHIIFYENTGTVTNPIFTRRTGTANPLEKIDFSSLVSQELIE